MEINEGSDESAELEGALNSDEEDEMEQDSESEEESHVREKPTSGQGFRYVTVGFSLFVQMQTGGICFTASVLGVTLPSMAMTVRKKRKRKVRRMRMRKRREKRKR